MRRLIFLFPLFATLPLLAGTIGPTGRYYLTAPVESTNWIIQGNTATAYPQHSVGGEGAIAIPSFDVRTLGDPASAGSGARYDLNFNYLGTNYAYPSGVHGIPGFVDGTSDGVHNYGVGYNFDYIVYQMNLDWSNPVELFTVSTMSLGITYDPINQSLWISDGFSSSLVHDYSLSGTLLFSFNTSADFITALAMDYTDGTLWLAHAHKDGVFSRTDGVYQQYDRNGNLLQTVTYANMAGSYTLGGEFANIPEPGTLWLLTAAAGLLILRLHLVNTGYPLSAIRGARKG
jgi:hypothetical protein